MSLRAIIICLLAMLVALPAWAAETRFLVQRFEITGANPLSAAETADLLGDWEARELGISEIREAARALQERMRDAGNIFHRVVVPPQDVEAGVVTFDVLTFRVGAIEVTGNAHHDRANVLAAVPVLVENRTPNTRELTRAIQMANAHPTKTLGVTLERSEAPDAVNARLTVRDRSPHQFFGQLNNRGSDATGDERLSIGYSHANLFNRDHQVTATYTTSPDAPDDVRQYGLSYQMPMYAWASDLTLLYSYSDVDNGTVAGGFDVTGQGEVLGARWNYRFLNRGRYRHNLSLAVIDKQFDNDVSFLGTPIGNDVRSRPLQLRYQGEQVQDAYNAGFYLELAYNLSGGSNNDDASYAATRLGAESDWYAVRYGGHLDWRFREDWLLRARLDAQWADDPLIPGEQFGLGGQFSVRGLDERELATDSAQRLGLELWLPRFEETLNTFLFTDVARGERSRPQPGEPDDIDLGSIGVGLRWQPSQRIRVTLDYGYVVEGAGRVDDGDSKLHFQLMGLL